MGESPKERQLEYEQLLRDLKNGSEEAATRLVERYSSNIMRAVRRDLPRAIRSKLDSADIFQSVWLSILVKRNDLTELDTPQRLIAYLTRTAKLKVLEKYRRYTRIQAYDVRREKRMSEPIETSAKAEKIAPLAKNILCDHRHSQPNTVAEAREAWNELIKNCSDRDRAIIQLRLQGKTYKVIADELGVSSRTVKRTMHDLLQLATHE